MYFAELGVCTGPGSNQIGTGWIDEPESASFLDHNFFQSDPILDMLDQNLHF